MLNVSVNTNPLGLPKRVRNHSKETIIQIEKRSFCVISYLKSMPSRLGPFFVVVEWMI